MAENLDFVARYAQSLGLTVLPRTVLVEGTSDAELFELAARLEHAQTGVSLVGTDLAIAAAGEGDRGGTSGVIRELMILRGLARNYLQPNGRLHYRFVGLFDNDTAGKQAVRNARNLDRSLIEYKDMFRLWPVMPIPGSLDPTNVQLVFERANALYKGLDWELEDLLPPAFIGDFCSENPTFCARTVVVNGRAHRDFTREGKARLHRFVKTHAIRRDLVGVVDTLKALRFYLGLPDPLMVDFG